MEEICDTCFLPHTTTIRIRTHKTEEEIGKTRALVSLPSFISLVGGGGSGCCNKPRWLKRKESFVPLLCVCVCVNWGDRRLREKEEEKLLLWFIAAPLSSGGDGRRLSKEEENRSGGDFRGKSVSEEESQWKREYLDSVFLSGQSNCHFGTAVPYFFSPPSLVCDTVIGAAEEPQCSFFSALN